MRPTRIYREEAYMKIRLSKSWGSIRRGKIYDYPEKTARYLVERVKVAEYVQEEEVVEKKITPETPKTFYQTKVMTPDIKEIAEKKKRGRPKKSDYEIKDAEIDE